MPRAQKEGARLSSIVSSATARRGELPDTPPTVRTPRRGRRQARRGVWSPRTTLAYCWRSRTLLGLGAWLAVSPWILKTTEDRHGTESALLTGVLLVGTGFWALLTREPVWPHACSLVLGVWLLVAPSLWYFAAPAATRSSLAVGLVVVALAVWLLWTGPRTRPSVDPAGADAQRSGHDDSGRLRGRA